MEKYISCKWKRQENGVAILMSDKIDFKIKTITTDKEGLYIMIKGSIQEEDITIINIYAPNIGAPQGTRQLLTAMKEEISNTIIVVDFNTSHQWTDDPDRKLIRKHKLQMTQETREKKKD